MPGETIHYPIIRSKLQRPPLDNDHVHRQHLLDLLNRNRHRPLALISAPAGYGKSTLASSWVAACDYPSGWVSLDRSDNDLRTFLSYVLTVIRSLVPEIELRTEALLEASQLPAISDLAGHLLIDLHQLTEPFVLLLDDYHRIQGGAPGHF